MSDLTPIYLSIITLTAIAGGLSLLVWKRSHLRYRLSFVLLMGSLVFISWTYFLDVASPTLSEKIFWNKMEYAGYLASLTLFLAFVSEFSGSKFLSRARLSIVLVTDAIIMLLVITNENHQMFYASTAASSDTYDSFSSSAGPLFYAYAIYSLIMIMVGVLVLVRASRRSSKAHRTRYRIMIVAGALPASIMAIYFLLPDFSYGILILIAGFITSGILVFVGAFSFELFDLVPFGLEKVMETTTDGVMILDDDGSLLYLNTASEKIFGVRFREVRHYPFEVMMAGPSMLRDQLVESKKGFDSTFMVGQDYYDVKVSEIKDQSNATVGRLVMFRDVTERKRAEQEAEEADMKLALMNSVTRHDILNQLLVVEGRMVLAESGQTMEEVRKHIATASVAIHNVQRQIAFSKDYQDAGVKSAVWHDMSLLMAKIRTQLDLNGVELTDKLQGIEFYADPLFEKVIYNLVDNSLKHGKTVTQISLASKGEGEAVKLIYEDNGKGIRPEMGQSLFQMGAGSHTGLGLFLSRRILAISRMTIDAENVKGGGARFVITIPEGQYRTKAS